MSENSNHGFEILTFSLHADGASLQLECKSDDGNHFSILIVQHFIIACISTDVLPGRIYVDDQLIELKSKEEAEILEGLSHYKISSTLESKMEDEDRDQLDKKLSQILDFYQSNASLEIEDEVKAKRGL